MNNFEKARVYFKKIESEIYAFGVPHEIVDPVSLALNHGVHVAKAKFDNVPGFENRVGYYRIDPIEDGSLKHSIGCKDPIPPAWYKFTLAHELAHYFLYLHKIYNLGPIEEPTIVSAMEMNNSTDESELSVAEIICNMFARAMLMPEKLFLDGVRYYRIKGISGQAANEDNSIASLLAKDFNVPFNHAFLRGKELGVFADG
jgi:Zn-dependent peptidase ImmA (M78 family)